MINKKIVIPFVVLGLLAFSTLATQSYASIQENTDPESAIVEKIATKFGLNKNDVQKVFDEQKTEMHADMQKKNEERLSQLVADGKISETQKTLILNKQKEMQQEREVNRNFKSSKTQGDRKAEMEAKKSELDAWAKDNGIDSQYLRPAFGGKGHGGPRMGM